MSKIRLGIGFPAYGGQITAHHAKMFMELGAQLMGSQRFEIVWFGFVDKNGVDHARNYLIAQAMMAGADWLFSVDADTWVEGYGKDEEYVDAGFQVMRMISEADHAGAAMVSASVIKRIGHGDAKREPAIYFQAGKALEPFRLADVPSKMCEEIASLPIAAVGAACFGLNLHSIGECMYCHTPLGEDLDFCRQLRALGGKILVDGRVKTGHLSRPFPLYTGLT